MTTFNLPSSIALSNPINSAWNTIVRANTINANNPADTTTKVHWASVGSSGLTDVFFELNNNVITVDVNNSPTGGAPSGVSKTGTGSGTDSITVTAGDTIYLHNGTWSSPLMSFVWQSSWTSTSGPTVSSITVANQNSATRTFTVTHTGTLAASDITYTLDNGYGAPIDVQTLASPNTGVTNIQATSTGSTFDSYLLNRNGLHSVTIDSTVITFVVDGTVQNVTATYPIPTTTVITPNDSSANSVTVYDRAADGKFLGYENSIGHHFNIRLKPNNKARLEVYLRNVSNTHFNDVAYSPLFTIGNQATMTFNYNPYGYDWGFSVIDWVYSAESEEDDSVAPVSTTSNGGRKRRYPIISTNLFDRQKSIFSIGLTHKDETLF